jgi:hypothetical protein
MFLVVGGAFPQFPDFSFLIRLRIISFHYIVQGDTIYSDDSFVVIDSFFKKNGLVHQQLESYNHFISHTMQRIVDESDALEFFPRKSARNRNGLVRFTLFVLVLGLFLVLVHLTLVLVLLLLV